MPGIKRVNTILLGLLIVLCGCGGAKDPGDVPTAADAPEAKTPLADTQAPETQPRHRR